MKVNLGRFAACAIVALVVARSAQASAVITGRIDDNLRIALIGNTLPVANATNDRGRVSDKLTVIHAQILLRRADAQERELGKVIADLHNPKSTTYHKWLTAKQFDARFGADSSDVAKITSWLTSHGLKVNGGSVARSIIDFSGNAGQIRETFGTEIHNISVDGQHHIANMSDPKIPVALSPAVKGIVSLNDFFGHTNFMRRSKPALTAGCFGGGFPCFGVVPADFATIYNLNPLLQKGITGKGQTIVVVEDTGIGDASTQTLSDADWTTFRKTFGLSSYKHGSFAQDSPAPISGVVNCVAPGINGNENEATLDAEWASAAAPDAAIRMVSCADTATPGVLIALENLVDSANPPGIVSTSYGLCEIRMGSTENAAFAATYQQGVAEGMTFFASSGDESSVSCDHDQPKARHGIAVSGYASTPYDTAVGGTDFGDIISQCTLSEAGTLAGLENCNKKYWSKTNSSVFGSAKSYIPEIPWNSSCASEVFATFVTGSAVTYGSTGFCNTAFGEHFITTGSGSGGPSGCITGQPAKFDVVSGSCKGYAKPVYQAVFGNPDDGVRDIPDVALFAANGLWNHFYLFCDSNGGGCQAGHPENWAAAGGTSFSSPIFAGIMALIEQKTGSRQGLANIELYALGAAQLGASGNAKCVSTLGTKSNSACVFHDVAEGDFNVPCVGMNNCYDPSGPVGVGSLNDETYKPAYKAALGWDFTTGLGTVNATNLVNAWQ